MKTAVLVLLAGIGSAGGCAGGGSMECPLTGRIVRQTPTEIWITWQIQNTREKPIWVATEWDEHPWRPPLPLAFVVQPGELAFVCGDYGLGEDRVQFIEGGFSARKRMLAPGATHEWTVKLPIPYKIEKLLLNPFTHEGGDNRFGEGDGEEVGRVWMAVEYWLCDPQKVPVSEKHGPADTVDGQLSRCLFAEGLLQGSSRDTTGWQRRKTINRIAVSEPILVDVKLVPVQHRSLF